MSRVATLLILLLAAGRAAAREGADLERDVVRAAGNGDLPTLTELLAKGAPPDARSPAGTALQLAVDLGRTEAARLLLGAGAKGVNDPYGPKKLRLLTLAAWKGSAELVELLLAHGADVAAVEPDGGDALGGAVAAGSLPCLERLLAAGADPNRRSARGLTAVARAAIHGRPEPLKVLLERRGDLEVRDHAGVTPLMFAAALGREEAVKLLLERGARPWPFENLGRSALTEARRLKDPEARDRIVAMLKAAGAPDRPDLRPADAQLLAACRRGDLAGVKAALKRGADLHVRGILVNGQWDRNCLSAAVRHPALVDFLLERGIDPHMVDGSGFTALHAAARDGVPVVVRTLVARGLDPNAPSRSGYTPVFETQNGPERPGNLAVLLERGGDPNGKAPGGEALLARARELKYRRIEKLLLDAGAVDPEVAPTATRSAAR